MQIKKITILTILVLLFFIGCGEKDKIDEDMISEGGITQKAPEFELKTHDGKDITITIEKDGWKFEGYENKAVLLNFFGTWCPPCKAEIPHLLNIKQRLKDDLKTQTDIPFEVLGIDIGKRDGSTNTQQEVDAFIEEFKVNYPIYVGEENKKLFGGISELNPGGSIPFMVLFNPQGQYVQHYIGLAKEEMLYSDISQAIQQKN